MYESAEHASVRLPGLVVAALAVLVIVSEYQRTLPGDWLWDFGSFIESGRAAREGLNPFGIYPLTFHVVLPGFESWNPNLNPPISALLFQAFSLAEPHRMFRIWYGISLAGYAATLVLLLQHHADKPRWLLALWFLALAGFWDTLLLGQIYIPLVLAGVGAWLLLERGAGMLAGVLIGVVVSMKPNFAVWPVLLLLAGHFRPAVAAIVTAALISAVPAFVLGPQVYQQWFELLAADEARAFFLTNASLTGLFSRIGIARVGLVIGVILLLVSAWWAFRHRPNAMRASAMGLVLSLLASPIAWVHYTLFLLPVLLHRWNLNGMRLAALMLIVPVPVVIAQFGRSAWAQVTVGSVYNWALVVCLVALVFDELRQLRRVPAAASPGMADPAAPVAVARP